MGDPLPDKLLNDPSPSLCFRKDEFMHDNFSVDTFVSEHRKNASLEKLRDDLGVHLKLLRSSMIELINKDYADFVNLSANLVGLDKFIKNISKPLEQLKEQVTDVKAVVEESLDKARSELEARRAVQEKKALLQQAVAVHKSVEKMERFLPGSGSTNGWTNERVEQLAMEVNQILFYLSKCKKVKLAGAMLERVEAVTELLQRHLEERLLASLDSPAELAALLRICATLDRVAVVEELLRRRLVAPALQEMVTPKALREVGLEGIYDQVTMFLTTQCQALLQVTSGRSLGLGFVERCLWPELCLALEQRVPEVFAPGQPDLFQKRLSATLALVDRLERLCPPLRDLCHHFLARWNLAIYFQLRFQEIGSQLEQALSQPAKLSQGGGEFRLCVQGVLWSQLERCWASDVFLDPLCHRLWKLTLQLLARHRSCLEALVAQPQGGLSPRELVLLYWDLNLLSSKLGPLMKETVQPRLDQAGFPHVALLQEGLEESSQLLESVRAAISARLVADLSVACCAQLKMVADIPRLYRRTNREVPSKASGYIQLVLVPLVTLREESLQDKGTPWEDSWTSATLEEVAKQYLVVTRDVLVSVKKMEDSLKRLKRARDRTRLPEGSASDDDKIRIQLCLDVDHFGTKMEELGTQKEDVPSFTALLDMVQAARSSPDQ